MCSWKLFSISFQFFPHYPLSATENAFEPCSLWRPPGIGPPCWGVLEPDTKSPPAPGCRRLPDPELWPPPQKNNDSAVTRMNNVTCFYYTSAPVVTGLPVTLNQHRLDNNEVGGHVCSSDVSVLRKLKTKQRKVLWFQQLKWFLFTVCTYKSDFVWRKKCFFPRLPDCYHWYYVKKAVFCGLSRPDFVHLSLSDHLVMFLVGSNTFDSLS